MTEETFKDQMYSLKKAGYRTITPEEMESYLDGKISLPEKAFLLAFDDGRLDSYVKADPILMAVGFHALMFVAVDSSIPQNGDHQTFYINAKDITKMLATGRWSIGSHGLQLTDGFVVTDDKGTQANFLSSKAWLPKEKRLETDEEYLARIKNEIDGSRQKLESQFGAKVSTFAYPFGDYGQQSGDIENATTTIQHLISDRYSMAFRQVWLRDGEFTLNYQDSDRLHLKRYETPTDWTGAQLVAFLATAQDKSLPFYDDFTKNVGWQETWGDVTRKEGGLSLSSNETATGAGVFIDGAKNWTDYTFNAAIDRTRGGYVSLMARYQDNQNYMTCSYGGGRVKIEEVSGGNRLKLIDITTAIPPSQNGSYGIRVVGTVIECLENGKTVATAATSMLQGGVGVKIWDETPDNAEILLKRVLVTAIN
jgi:peptidoglycan/xylan/chitin deacetylase (PgdA/CDA1 family)